jgi:hypothetical protein
MLVVRRSTYNFTFLYYNYNVTYGAVNRKNCVCYCNRLDDSIWQISLNT